MTQDFANKNFLKLPKPHSKYAHALAIRKSMFYKGQKIKIKLL